jgi:putative phosphoribosyl transferase
MSIFLDRADAGRKLAEKLQEFSGRQDALILALPRGGVPVAYEVAAALNLALDVFLVRKLRAPDDVEITMGVIAAGGLRVLDEDIIKRRGIPDSVIARVAAQEQRELRREETLYRPDKSDYRLNDRTVIVVDDGVATGESIRAALAAVNARKPAGVVVAVPVIGAEACRSLLGLAERLIWVICIEEFGSFGRWYDSFEPVTDKQVQGLLTRAEAIAGYAE